MILKLLTASIKLLLLMATLVTVAAIGIGQRIPKAHHGGLHLRHLTTSSTRPSRPSTAGGRSSFASSGPVGDAPPTARGGHRQGKLVAVGGGRAASNRRGRLEPIRGRGILVDHRTWPHTHEPPRWRGPRPIDPVRRSLAGGLALLDPGAPASVLYVGGDYRCYRSTSGRPPVDRGTEDVADTHPRPFEWQAPLPGAGDVQFRDLTWPDEPRLGGRALVSLRFKDRETGRYTDWQVWWLQLDRGGTSIVAAGRLLEPGPSGTAVSRRHPNLVSVRRRTGPGLSRARPGESGYQLRVAPIHFDPDSGSLQAHDVDSRPLAEDCRSRPAPSPPRTAGGSPSCVPPAAPERRTDRDPWRSGLELTSSDRLLLARLVHSSVGLCRANCGSPPRRVASTSRRAG